MKSASDDAVITAKTRGFKRGHATNRGEGQEYGQDKGEHHGHRNGTHAKGAFASKLTASVKGTAHHAATGRRAGAMPGTTHETSTVMRPTTQASVNKGATTMFATGDISGS